MLKLSSIYKIRDTKLSVETVEQTETAGLGYEIDTSQTHL